MKISRVTLRQIIKEEAPSLAEAPSSQTKLVPRAQLKRTAQKQRDNWRQAVTVPIPQLQPPATKPYGGKVLRRSATHRRNLYWRFF